MRIISLGAAVFIIWGFFSTWLFVDIIRPSLEKKVEAAAAPETTDSVADSLARIYALMPKDLVIRYDFDKAGFDTDPQLDASLAEFKEWLDKYPESILLVTGHTDLVGTPEYNESLGLERAQAVQEYLESKGFPASRMTVTSKGEKEPAAGYITAEERAKNRRTVISIKK
jgi:outer membrane protein OmpA-like peptidoglycan-associated protein